jgi:hypothetical protein
VRNPTRQKRKGLVIELFKLSMLAEMASKVLALLKAESHRKGIEKITAAKKRTFLH